MGKQSRAKISEDKYIALLSRKVDNIEVLAKELHEAGREAVLNNKVLKPDGAPVGQIVFKEWDDLPEEAKEGRRIQIRYLLNNFMFIRKEGL